MNTYPQISLDAINKQAALLFSRKNSASIEQFYNFRSSLMEKLEELRGSEDMKPYCKALHKMLASANSVIEGIKAHNARIKNAEESAKKREAAAKFQEQVSHNKMERIKAANEGRLLFLEAFRKNARELLGEHEYIKLIQKTVAQTTLQSP